jgi:hypothetical protein
VRGELYKVVTVFRKDQFLLWNDDVAYCNELHLERRLLGERMLYYENGRCVFTGAMLPSRRRKSNLGDRVTSQDWGLMRWGRWSVLRGWVS